MKDQHDHERDLVDFLKAHHPVPPLVDPQLEERLMQRITDSSLEGSKDGQKFRSRRFWVVSGVMVASVVLTLGTFPLLNRNGGSLLFTHSNPNNLADSEQAALEEFMLNTWGMEGTSTSTVASSWDNNWLALANFETETVSY